MIVDELIEDGEEIPTEPKEDIEAFPETGIAVTV